MFVYYKSRLASDKLEIMRLTIFNPVRVDEIRRIDDKLLEAFMQTSDRPKMSKAEHLQSQIKFRLGLFITVTWTGNRLW